MSDAVFVPVQLFTLIAQPVIMCFVELTKACDNVRHGVPWEVLQEFGVLGLLLRAIRYIYNCNESLFRIAS